jgi:HNH endonuclease
VVALPDSRKSAIIGVLRNQQGCRVNWCEEIGGHAVKPKKKSHKLLDKAKKVARQVRKDLHKKLNLGRTRWRKVVGRFRPGNGTYGRYPVAELDDADRKITFDIWVDQLHPSGTMGSAPMLAAAFCDEGDVWNRNKVQFPDCSPHEYGKPITKRKIGFGGEVVVETDPAPAPHRRYLTVYRPPADTASGRNDHPDAPLDPRKASRLFLAFFNKWRTKVECRARPKPPTTLVSELVKAERRRIKASKLMRYAPQLTALKEAYEHLCQIDQNHRLDLPHDVPYVEVHHLKPLAEGGSLTGHKFSNCVVVCPSCHVLLQDGAIWLDPADGRTVRHFQNDRRFRGRKIKLLKWHSLDRKVLRDLTGSARS